MRKTNKIDFKKASANMIERLEKVFRAKATDVWHRGQAGAIITFELPPFCNSMDVMSEAGLNIAIAKNRGNINDGSVNSDNKGNIIVKLF
jgi:hypothetical protein